MKMTKGLFKILVIQIIISSFSLTGYALEKPTHFEINEYIARHEIVGFSFDEYLKDQLGFQDGVNTIIEHPIITIIHKEPTTVFRWLGYGGEQEDEPYLLRSLRHFHNPLIETWDEAGLWGIFESSVIWGQRTDQWPGGGYSWQDVRNYFYTALTSEEPGTRENYFAATFRGIGQLMHLVEDASVPLHTRNDAHVRFNYEKWVDKFQRNKYNDEDDEIFNIWLSNESRYGYDKSILSIAPNPLAPVPVARIIDTDQYIGNNPEITKSEPVGIAEYTNANFLSNGTIPGTIFDGDFPYPNIPDLPSSDWEIIDPRNTSTTVKRSYFMTGNDTDVDGRYRLATKPMFELVFYENLDEGFLAILPTSLDKDVYQDYAERLIPRAVGYSAGLLDYFFRGEIDMVPDEENGNGYIIKNLSDEDLEGTFSLYYDDESEVRVQIESGNFPLEISIPGNNKSGNINFTIPDSPKEPGKYILVFKGKLGNEEDAVVGKIIDINPYLLITIDGGTDRAICFVWNISENKYAHVLDADSYPISFPCNKSELAAWLSDTYLVGESLFTPLPGCDSTRLDVDDCDTPEGCWDYNGECTDEETRASSCVDTDGSPLMNIARINRTDVTVCHGPPYCAENSPSVQKQITREGSCYGGIRSMNLAARNNSGIVTSVRTKEEYNQNYTKHYYDDGSGCIEMGLAYVKMDELIESKYTIFTPIGELVNYDLSQEHYALWGFFDLGQGNQTDESVKSSLYGVYGLYYGNVMVQLYYYDYLKKIETRPCGQIPWLGWVPWDWSGPNDIPCEYDSIVYVDNIFSVLAQADVVNDPDNQDPTQLSRNNGLEGAIRSLRERLENEYGNSSEDTLTNYILSIDLRIEK